MNDAMVLGVAGKIASGKSTVSTKIAEALGWPCVSFGDYVRSVARQRGLKESRAVLQEIGASLVDNECEQFCWGVVNQSGWDPGHSLVIDGIRHLKVVETLRNIVDPSVLYIIFIQASDDKRRSRLGAEGILNDEQLRRIESDSTETQVVGLLLEAADLVVDANKSVDLIVEDIVAWAHRQM